jgi:hypothetical protein
MDFSLREAAAGILGIVAGLAALVLIKGVLQ